MLKLPPIKPPFEAVFLWCGVANLRGARLAQIVRGSELLIVRLAVVSDVLLTAKS